MTIQQDIQKSELPARIKLFKIDFGKTNIPELSEVIQYWTPMTDNGSPVLFGNQEYLPFPIEISGIEFNSEEAPGRPLLEVSNITKLLGTMSFIYNDLIGAEVTYIETFATYLNTSSEISLPPLRLTVAKKLTHNKFKVGYELRFPLDKERAFLPKRLMLRDEFPGLGINKRV